MIIILPPAKSSFALHLFIIIPLPAIGSIFEPLKVEHNNSYNAAALNDGSPMIIISASRPG